MRSNNDGMVEFTMRVVADGNQQVRWMPSFKQACWAQLSTVQV